MIKASLIVLLGLAATTLLRKRSAALRHWVLAAAIACAAATPALELVVPTWQLPVSVSLFGRRVEPLTLFIPVSETRAQAPSDDMPGERSRPAQRTPALRSLGWIWMAGVGISLSFLFIGFARLGWLASRSQQIVRGTWTELADTLSRGLGLRRRVLLLQSDHPTLLVTWGVRRPTVILPQAARDWSEDRVRIVLGHELAHIRRGDWLVQMAAELLRSVYWFNPILWIACRRLRRESEHACDDAVLSLGIEAPEYATHLLDLARAFRRDRRTLFPGVPEFPAPAMARPSSLERRVSAMLNARLNRTPITRFACVATAIALLGLTVAIAGIAASAQNAGATFSGSLVDAIGRTVPDVPMVLSNPETSQTHEARSDQSGHFSFAGLPAGSYLLEVRKAGFATTQGRVTLRAGQILQQDVALQLGSLQETITLTDQPGPEAERVDSRVRQAPAQSEFDPCSESPVGGCIKQPTKVRDVKPRYPPAQHEAGSGGTVEIEARIDTEGFTKDLRVLEAANADFANAALEAVGQWQFTPTRLDGVPVEVRMKVTVNFIVRQ